MNFYRIPILIIIIFFLAIPNPEGAEKASSVSFIIDIIGTNTFDDVSVIQSGIRKSDGTLNVNITSSTKNLVRLEGLTKASSKSFASDIFGLALNRFDIEQTVKPDGSIFITLRKKPPIYKLIRQ